MALTFGSIASECRSGNSAGHMNAADRAYIEECRRNSVLLIDPNKLSVTYTSSNPYHASYQKQQRQLLQQNLQLKTLSQKSRLRRSLIWAFVLSFLFSLVVLSVVVFASDIEHGHYVQYFTMLIVILSVACLFTLVGTRACRLVTDWRKKASQSAEQAAKKQITLQAKNNGGDVAVSNTV